MIKKFMKSLMVLFIMVSVIQPTSVNAASISVSASSTEVKVGESVTFTVTVSGGAGTINADGEETFLDESSETFTRSYSEAGTYTFLVSGLIGDYETETESTLYGSATVTVVAPQQETPSVTPEPEPEPEPEYVPSDDARLWSLSVDKGELSPSFESGVTDYSVELTSKDTEIYISAEQWNDYASVEGANKAYPLSIGNNSFTITVTAEDEKTTRSYTINVIVKSVPVTYVNFNDKQYGIMKEYPNGDIPKGFTVSSATINEENVPVFENEAKTITLVYAQDPEENYGFYVYTEDHGILALYRPIVINKQELYIVDIPEDLKTREGMTLKSIKIANETLDAWVFEDEDLVDYTLLYVVNGEGVLGYYLYNGSTQKIEAYPESNPITYDAFVEAGIIEKEPVNYMLIGGIAAVVIAIVGAIVWFVRKNKKQDQEEIEEQPVTIEETKEFKIEKEPEPEVVVHPIETDLLKLKEADEEEMTMPEIKDDDDDDDWLNDDFIHMLTDDDE